MVFQFDKLTFPLTPQIKKEGQGLDDIRLHIAATALKKNSFCGEFLSKRDMTYKQIADYCDVVNVKQEVGTLFPKFRFTLIPVIDKEDVQTAGFPENYLIDVFTAHSLYFSTCTTLLFVIDTSTGYDVEAVKNSIRSYVEAKSEKETWMAQLSYLIASYP